MEEIFEISVRGLLSLRLKTSHSKFPIVIVCFLSYFWGDKSLSSVILLHLSSSKG